MNFEELGLMLRQEREAQGLSIEAVMETTKISRINIVAIEGGDRSVLPHPVYTKGFVKSYARMLGLDAEELSMVVDQEFQGVNPEEDITIYEVSPSAERAFHDDVPQRKRSVWPSILAVVIVSCLILGVVFFLNRNSSETVVVPPVVDNSATQTPAAEEPVAQPDATEDVAPEVSAEEQGLVAPADADEQGAAEEEVPAPPADELETPAEEVVTPPAAAPAGDEENETVAQDIEYAHVLIIRATTEDGCWVGVWRGDETKIARNFILTKDEPLRLMFNTPRRIRIGNAAGVDVTYNGKPFPITDAKGNVKNLRFGFEGDE